MGSNLYPLKLSAVPREIIWGGDRLKKTYNKQAEFEKIAESWELCVRPKEMNVIKNGIFCGEIFENYIEKFGTSVICANFNGDRFPLLIKFIDACDRLSIQVHPDDEFGIKNENELGKTEMWYIVEADEEAQIVYGLKEGCSAEDFKIAVENDNTESVLNFVNVHAGETYFIPSGLVHAIGAGILIAEIQQNSDVTYRVYDYNRKQTDGTLRQLHTEKALQVTKIFTEFEINELRYSKIDLNNTGDVLASCKYFEVTRLSLDKNGNECLLEATSKSFHSLLCLSGNAKINFHGNEYDVICGDSYFIPASMGKYSISGNAVILLSTI